MKLFRQTISIVIILLTIYIIISCSTTRYSLSVFKKSGNLPEGVDSLIVAKSDSIIKYLFVDYPSKQKADRLAKDAWIALNQADSIWHRLEKLKLDSTKLNSNVKSDSSSREIVESSPLIKDMKENLQSAERNFLGSVRLNPFSLYTRDGLAQVYILWANIEKNDIFYEKALAVFEEMINFEKGEHLLFYKLGECFFQLKKWDQALLNYLQAEKVLLATTFYADSILRKAPPNDSVKNDLHFNYLYSQAVCLARMYKAQEALSIIKEAKETAPSLERKKIAERFEDWLNWDNGNIHAAEERNHILELIKNKQYAEAVTRLDQLKKQLSDQIAIDEIEWRIAGLEFNYLDKKEHACNRLLAIVKKSERSLYYPDHLIPSYEKYINDCGIMHYHLGIEFIQKAEYKEAQQYLGQGAILNWYGKYKCQLELAKLNRHNPQASLEIIEKVLNGEDSLTVPERLSALEIKLSALRKLGPQYLSETKQIYQQIRELQEK